MKPKTTMLTFPNWCAKHGLKIKELNDDLLFQLFIYYNSQQAKKNGRK
jgi:hypothetical protein